MQEEDSREAVMWSERNGKRVCNLLGGRGFSELE